MQVATIPRTPTDGADLLHGGNDAAASASARDERAAAVRASLADPREVVLAAARLINPNVI